MRGLENRSPVHRRADKGLSGGHGASSRGENLPDMRTWRLRQLRSVAIAQADIQQSGLVPCEPYTVAASGRPDRATQRDPIVIVCLRAGTLSATTGASATASAAGIVRRSWSAEPSVSNEDVFDVSERRPTIPPRACDGSCGHARSLVIRKLLTLEFGHGTARSGVARRYAKGDQRFCANCGGRDRPSCRESFGHHVRQRTERRRSSTTPLRTTRRRPGWPATADVALRDEKIAIWKERDPPWVHDVPGHDDDAESIRTVRVFPRPLAECPPATATAATAAALTRGTRCAWRTLSRTRSRRRCLLRNTVNTGKHGKECKRHCHGQSPGDER